MGDPIPVAINGRFVGQRITGVQRVARELTCEIDRMLGEGDDRFRVQLICEPGADLQGMALSHIDVVEAPGAHGWMWEQTVLPRAARGNILLCLGNTAPLLSLLFQQPCGLMIHDLSYRKFPSAYRLRYRLFHASLLPVLLARARPIFTVSKTEEKVLRRLAPKLGSDLTVAQNGGWRGNRAPQTAEDALHPPRNYALYVGSLSLRKNFAGLRDVAIRLASEDDLDFVFVGSAGRILTPVVRDIPEELRHRIHFVGQIEDPAKLGEFYKNARCLVFPSFYEASAIPPLEAMHFGCPVVTSRLPSMVERCGDAAEYCDPYDAESILASVRRVLYDPLRAAELVRLGYERNQRFSWRTQAQTILDAISVAHAAEALGGSSSESVGLPS